MSTKKSLKQKIINEIKRIAKEQNSKTIPRRVFKRNSNISERQIYQVFKDWNDAVASAGLTPNISNKRKSDDALFEELLRVCKKENAIPTGIAFERLSKFSISTYTKNRYGKWTNVLIKFKEWLKRKHPNSKFIVQLPNNQNQIPRVPKTNNEKGGFVWPSKKSVVYGPPIDFRGLRHEPVNEQGVVFLFGKISEELGFSIEAIRTDYPDCDGKRLINKNKNLWEPVTVEFEYKSSNFLEHGHDPSKCDVIICWIHNWSESPLEVIELRTVIKNLKNSQK